MKKLLIIIAVLTSTASFAQRSFWSFNYPISFALGEQQDFIGKTSFRGFGIDGRGFLNNNISIGGHWSWEVFNEIKRDLPPIPINVSNDANIKGEISGVQYRFLNVMPILVNAHYYMGSDGAVRPYVGLGIGTSYVDERTDIGLVSIQTKTWRFALQPEAGVMIPFGLTGVGANVAARFRYAAKAGDSLPISFFSLSVGLGFMN